jgi:hypothetical protein
VATSKKKPAAKKAALSENRQRTDKRPAPKTAFKPGQSGNPGGRPPKTEEQRTLETMCRERTPEALATVLTIMGAGENERNRLSAAQFVIERGWGKAVQSLEHSGKDGGPIQSKVDATLNLTPAEVYKQLLGG